jgi:predicted MFS family arabinose efflux permease
VLLGLNNSAIYAGVAAGGALGGILQQAMPVTLLGLAGAALSAAGALLTSATGAPRERRSAAGVERSGGR